MTKDSRPITPGDTEAVDRKIAEDFGILRSTEFIQIGLVGLAANVFLWGHALGGLKSPALCVGVGLLVLVAILTPVTLNFRKQSKKAYKAFFEQYEFVTPAGEEVVFVSSNHTGTHLNVRFLDGHEATYPLHQLSNKVGQLHEWARFKHPYGDHLKNLSKMKWRTPEGKIGVVRDVDFPRDRDIKLRLKLEDGQIASFDLGSLEPISAAAVLLAKSEAAIQ
ncbi:hypothetical protein O9X98_10405 [Agrobacterium salinitolerans]|nr:hypothetical protein [Agrobacterium salinitolerans]